MSCQWVTRLRCSLGLGGFLLEDISYGDKAEEVWEKAYPSSQVRGYQKFQVKRQVPSDGARTPRWVFEWTGTVDAGIGWQYREHSDMENILKLRKGIRQEAVVPSSPSTQNWFTPGHCYIVGEQTAVSLNKGRLVFIPVLCEQTQPRGDHSRTRLSKAQFIFKPDSLSYNMKWDQVCGTWSKSITGNVNEMLGC